MKEKKLGGGILTCTIINLVLYGFGIVGLLISLLGKDFIEQTLTQSGQTDALAQLSTLNIVFSLVITSLLLISSILILCKKKIGVYSFFTLVVLNIIYGIITTGFKPLSLIGLILPALLGLFIYKRRSIFGFSNPEEDQSIDA
ncbi:hypothetical protein [Clostridium gasigenes]|uniref:DUF4064 domain-containing protein n=1 Tax=Clostridium gasigenes TaxID=94869 RepID=A0A7X0SA16_9CLOT|nr:hypothetical protein [Clostridium gasigenes]MBB6713818.1 hypothetical protein [Clostridium gasigenes]